MTSRKTLAGSDNKPGTLRLSYITDFVPKTQKQKALLASMDPDQRETALDLVNSLRRRTAPSSDRLRALRNEVD